MIIGVTGGVGSGKTVFASELGQMGAYVIDVDKMAKQLVRRNIDIQTSLRRTFGYGIFGQSRKLRRKELGKIVFTDSTKLASLNRILHSPLIKELRTEIELQKKKGKDQPIVVDMAILFETRFESFCDLIVIVVAPLEKRVDWLYKGRGWSFEEIFSRIHAQKSIEQNMKKADVIIENSGTLAGLRGKAKGFFKHYVQGE
ncbi:dephospho-CoA kinase [bacterium]|nr:dephospho-CoA kinase [bacterium]